MTSDLSGIQLYGENGDRVPSDDDAEFALNNGFSLYIVQGTEQVGNLFIDRGQLIHPGGTNNATEQGDWLETHTDVRNLNNDETSPLWPTYPTGDETLQGGSDSGVRHPGVRFDQAYDGSPHATQ